MTTGMPFSDLMGVDVLERTKERVRGRMLVRDDLCTSGRICHGGAYMAFADALGATGAVMNLAEGTRATRLESKTNFLGGARGVDHRGRIRRPSVRQTRITDADGKPPAR